MSEFIFRNIKLSGITYFCGEYPFETLDELRPLRHLVDINIYSKVLEDISQAMDFPRLRRLSIYNEKLKISKATIDMCRKRKIQVILNRQNLTS
jgi:hypothetical protein